MKRERVMYKSKIHLNTGDTRYSFFATQQKQNQKCFASCTRPSPHNSCQQQSIMLLDCIDDTDAQFHSLHQLYK